LSRSYIILFNKSLALENFDSWIGEKYLYIFGEVFDEYPKMRFSSTRKVKHETMPDERKCLQEW